MFIYAMDEKSKEQLEALGYELLKTSSNMWVFINKPESQFENIGVSCVISDTLIF